MVMMSSEYSGVGADALRELAYLAAERADEIRQLQAEGDQFEYQIFVLDEQMFPVNG